MVEIAWESAAINELAAIWTNATHRSAVNAAVDEIEHESESDPLGAGESRGPGRRVLLPAPLGVRFHADATGRVVYVTSVWSFGRRPSR